MAISVTPVLPVQPAQEVAVVTPELVLRPGSTIDATVLKVLSADLVRIAIASLSIDVKTEIPLQPGQALKLAVSQTENGIRLTNVSGNAVELARAPAAGIAEPQLDAVRSRHRERQSLAVRRPRGHSHCAALR